MAEYSEDIKEKIVEMSEQGMSGRQIASILGISKSGVNDFIKRVGITPVSESYEPRVLIYDIETAPSLGFFWGRWKENLHQSKVVREGYMLTWAAKWLGDESSVMFDSLRMNPGEYFEDDSKIVCSLADVIRKADIIIAHNNNRFDFPTVQTYMLRNNMDPLPPVKLIDTLRIAKKNFRFPSNSLDSLAIYLGLQGKMNHTGFDLWRRCMEGDPEAWDTMMEYNIQDVHVLENVYMKLRPWDRQHPNVSLYYPNGVKRCPVCGSTHVQPSDYLAYTSVGAYTTFRCDDCGKYSRTRQNLKSKEQRQNVLSNIAS